MDLLNRRDAQSDMRFYRAAELSAFTLVELLVSVATVTLLILIVVSMTNSASTLINFDNKKMDADGEARTVFDRMAGDFDAMVKRSDVDYQFNNRANEQNGSATLFFYSEAPAILASANVADNSSASLVGYRINSLYQLERLGKGLQWSPNASTSKDGAADGMTYLTYADYPITSASVPVAGSTLTGAFSSVVSVGSRDSNYHVIGDGVFRFDFWFLLKPYTKSDGTYLPAIYSNYPYDVRRPGHTSTYCVGVEDVQAIVVVIAILDTASRRLLPAGINWNNIVDAFQDPADPFAAPVPTWEGTANTGVLVSKAGIPKPVAAQVRVYKRTFNLITSINQ